MSESNSWDCGSGRQKHALGTCGDVKELTHRHTVLTVRGSMSNFFACNWDVHK